MGVVVKAEEILTPVIAVRNWVASEGLTRVAYFVAEETRQDFDRATEVDAGEVTAVDAVVIGDLGEAWDFRTLNQAFRLLMDNPDAPLVALGMTRYWRAEDGLWLDVAPFVVALEHATGRHARVMGKPSTGFFQQTMDGCGLKSEELVMIGDDIRDDVDGAQRAGLSAVLVRTGKFSEQDLDGEVRPDAVLDSLAGLKDYWENASAR
jgi:phospholysine phosphohistidine inorganic pyrophosphate phosphatase